MNSSQSGDFLISGYSVLDDISILFTSSKSTTPSFSSTILDLVSENSNCFKPEKNMEKLNTNRNYGEILQTQVSVRDHNFDTTYEACQFTVEHNETSNFNRNILSPSKTEDGEVIEYLDENTSNNKLEMCPYCKQYGNEVNFDSRMIGALKNKTQSNKYGCMNSNGFNINAKSLPLGRNYSNMNYQNTGEVNSDPEHLKTKKSKRSPCSCCFNVSFGLCIFGFILVVMGTSIFSGCWVYLVYVSSRICSKVVYIHVMWHFLYAINIFMVGFPLIVVLLISNSRNKRNIFSMMRNPNCGKNCSIIILQIIFLQLIVWVIIFAIQFYIIMDFYMKNNLKLFCGIINLSLEFSTISVNRQNVKPPFDYSLLLSINGAFIEVVGLLILIVGVSMCYQRMKSEITKTKLRKGVKTLDREKPNQKM